MPISAADRYHVESLPSTLEQPHEYSIMELLQMVSYLLPRSVAERGLRAVCQIGHQPHPRHRPVYRQYRDPNQLIHTTNHFDCRGAISGYLSIFVIFCPNVPPYVAGHTLFESIKSPPCDSTKSLLVNKYLLIISPPEIMFQYKNYNSLDSSIAYCIDDIQSYSGDSPLLYRDNKFICKT